MCSNSRIPINASTPRRPPDRLTDRSTEPTAKAAVPARSQHGADSQGSGSGTIGAGGLQSGVGGGHQVGAGGAAGSIGGGFSNGLETSKSIKIPDPVVLVDRDTTE